jgi:hypothetical protein
MACGNAVERPRLNIASDGGRGGGDADVVAQADDLPVAGGQHDDAGQRELAGGRAGPEDFLLDDDRFRVAGVVDGMGAVALVLQGLSAAVMNSALDRGNGLVSAWHAELFEVGAALLPRARQSGAVPPDADDADVMKMVGAIAWAAQDSPDSPAQADRLLALLVNGLRHPGGRR